MLPTPVRQPRCPSFVAGLVDHGDATAVVADGRTLTYTELAERVADWRRRLGDVRRLVLLVGGNHLRALTAYLGALAGGHVVLLVPDGEPRHLAGWTDRYDPDVVIDPRDAAPVRERRDGTAHDLHPDLALLMSTSGSTGSAKLVRLSYENLEANAAAIAAVLPIRPTDRAVTTLPMAYCYGLSVLHSHLARGAGVVLTDRSVVDEQFWELCRRHGVTSLAGVPHTYRLLERCGFLDTDLPSLRYLTQAGGRMPPEQVRRFALAGRERGWQLFVMYGQTEATARMTCLPATLAAHRPESVGAPVPGGSLRLEPVPGEPDQHELVYTGPNVMLGYADGPADLGLGRTVQELRTGDLGRRAPDGLFEVTGRRSRTGKVFGLRIDLDAVERALEDSGVVGWCVDLDDVLVVLVEQGRPAAARRLAAAAGALPLSCVRSVPVAALPRLANGKTDDVAARRVAGAALTGRRGGNPPAARRPVRAIYAQVLGRPDVPDDASFVSLGGDSLSYVEASLRLEELLGALPADWPVLPVRVLQAQALPPQSDGTVGTGRRVETTVLLRALAIVLITGSHAHLFSIVGGAHALVAVAGFNFARFRLSGASRTDRCRGLWASVRRVLLPSVVLISLAAVTTPGVGWAQVALLTNLLGPAELGPAWRYWFVEALVQTLVALAVLLQIPALDRAERRYRFGFPAAILAVGLLPRTELVNLGSGPVGTQSSLAVLWLFALGWCASRAATVLQRWLVTVVTLLLVPGFFQRPSQGAVVVAAVLLLVWTSSLPLGRLGDRLQPLIGVLAGSSLYVYLTQWQVLAVVPHDQPWLATIGSFAVGVAVWRTAGGLARVMSGVSGPPVGAPDAPGWSLRPHPRREPARRRHLLSSGAASRQQDRRAAQGDVTWQDDDRLAPARPSGRSDRRRQPAHWYP